MFFQTLQTTNGLMLNITREQALEAGATEEEVNTAASALRVAAIKAECRRRIYEYASPEAQMNVATALGAASAKTASTRSAEETALISGAHAALGWIGAMRNQIAILAADMDVDYTADAAWPDLPAEAGAVYSQF